MFMGIMEMLLVMQSLCWDAKRTLKNYGGLGMGIIPVLLIMEILGHVLSGMTLYRASQHQHIICKK